VIVKESKMGKRKPFIDKKNAITFKLVHRSQRDPLAADNDAPQLILHEVGTAQQRLTGHNLRKTKEEEQEAGVFFDDEYNYLQHMKDRSNEEEASVLERYVIKAEDYKKSKPKKGDLGLASNLFATEGEEEEVGLLNKAAPRGLDLSLDPDIVAAMDEDFNYDDPENQLDDDLIMQLMGEEGGADDVGSDEEGDWGSDDGGSDSDFMGGRSDEEYDEVPELYDFEEEETKTKFTNYSMSSSVIRRNKGLETLDDQFEKFMDQYGDFDEGALDGEDIEGHLDEKSVRMEDLIEEADKAKKEEYQRIIKEKEMCKRLAIVQEDQELETVAVEAPDCRWDAESILTTYSNKYNHPKLISERKTYDAIELSSKTGIPKNTLGRGLTAAALKQLDRENYREREDDDFEIESVASRASQLSIRNKHETLDEKRVRKQAVKEFRRERRIERKANTQAFKDEGKRQEKIMLNNRTTLQGNKIL